MILERNVSEYCTSMLMVFCVLVLAAIAAAKSSEAGRGVRYWTGLAFVFLFLAVDEYIGIHEKMSASMREMLGTSFDLVWVIPYAALVLIVLLVYTNLQRKLPGKTQDLSILSALIYAVGAVGLELFSGQQGTLHGRDGATYFTAITTEECFEITGGILFLLSLLTYISNADLKFRLSKPEMSKRIGR